MVRTGKIVIRACIVFLILLAAVSAGDVGTSQAKTIQASISAKSVKIGSRIRVRSKTVGVTFASSDTTRAVVDPEGWITGKKTGKVKIYVRCTGAKTVTYKIQVKRTPYKPANLPVAYAEVGVEEIFSLPDGRTIYETQIKNNSKKGKINKIIYYYTVSAQAPPVDPAELPVASSGAATPVIPHKTVKKALTVTARNIQPGKTVKAERKVADGYIYTGSLSDIAPSRIELYTGNALYIYHNNAYSLQWGTKDTTPPQISGLVEKKSYSGYGDAYRICYSDRKETYRFTEFVSVQDDRDSSVVLKVDTKRINWKKSGKYKVYYYATDKAGNTAVSWARVQVYVPGKAEAEADRILRSVIRKGWSDKKKVKAIYRYIQRHSTYVQRAGHGDWRKSAIRGLRQKSGDYYTYYAMARLLLTRAGISNVMIKRHPASGGNHHFWNLVYVQGGWYHFDTAPRTKDVKPCLWTDVQLRKYAGGKMFRFKKSSFPARAEKKITKVRSGSKK